MKIKFDYSKLLGKMKELGYTQSKLADKIGISATTFNIIIAGNGYFRQNTIEMIRTTLGITTDEIGLYFFKIKVQENWK